MRIFIAVALLLMTTGCSPSEPKGVIETECVAQKDLQDWFGKHKNVTINAVATSERPFQQVFMLTGERRTEAIVQLPITENEPVR